MIQSIMTKLNICIKIVSTGNHLQFILISNYTKNTNIVNFVYYGKNSVLHANWYCRK